MVEIAFYIISFLTLSTAIGVIVSKNAMHSVLFLVMTFFTISAQYILLNAQFLALVNIVVYAGAVMVLFLFVIMFLNLNKDADFYKPMLGRLSAVLAGGTLFVVLISALKTAAVFNTSEFTNNSQIGLVENLGKVLYTEYLIPFELSAVLFIVAMIGAITIAKKDDAVKD